MKRTLVALLLFFTFAGHSRAQWVSTGPPGGGVNVLRIEGDRLYAGADAGLFLSHDSGASWSRLLTVPDMGITLLAIDPRNPSVLFAVASQHASYFGSLFINTRLFKSVDGGLSWRELTNGLPAAQSIASLAIDSDSTVYLGLQCGVQTFSQKTVACDSCAQLTPGAGVYKSVDGGETWVVSGGDLTGESLCVRGVAADPLSSALYVYSETLISTFILRHSRSTDGGATWAIAPVTSPSREIRIHESGKRLALSNPSSCGQCTPSTGIVVSDDGENWRSITDSLSIGSGSVVGYAVDPRNDSNVYAATTAGLFRTTDGGQHWIASAPASAFRGARTVVVDESGARVYLGTSTGLFVSRDNGSSWSAVSLAQSGWSVANLAVAEDGTLYGLLQDFDLPRAVVRSVDEGRNWDFLGSVGSLTSLAWWAGERPPLAVGADGALYVLNGDSPQLIKRFARNQWTDLEFPRDRFPQAIAPDPRDPNTLYVVAYPGDVLKTTDGGRTWREVTHHEGGAWTIAAAPTSPTTVYFGYGSTLARSLDGGETWSDVLTAGQVTGIAIPRSRPESVYVLTCCGGFVRRSDDRGSTWRTLQAPSDARGIAVDADNPDVVYLRYLGGPKILKSRDAGASWRPFTGGLTGAVVNDLVVDRSGRMYAATFRSGVYVFAEPVRRRSVSPAR